MTDNANTNYAQLESPSFTGTPVTTTPNYTDNSTRIPTTLWVNYIISSALSSYVTTSALSSYVTSSSLSSTLSSYALSSALSNYVTSSSLSSTLSNYALSSALSNYVPTSSLSSTLSMTNASLSGTLSVGSTTLWNGLNAVSGSMFLGDSTAGSTNSGTNNTVVGKGAGTAITSGYNNTCVGYGSGAQTTTAIGGTFIGKNAGYSHNTTGDYNTIVGQDAGIYLRGGHSNTIIGAGAGAGTTPSTYFSGYYNNLMGLNAGNALTTGASNVCVGTQSGISLTSGNDNILIGTNSGNYMSGSANVAIGTGTLGGQSSSTKLSGNYNVGICHGAGQSISTGNGNICIGLNTGASGTESQNYTTGSYNILIGYGANGNGSGNTDEIVIGRVMGKGSNTTTLSGNTTYITNQNATPLVTISADTVGGSPVLLVSNTTTGNNHTGIQVVNAANMYQNSLRLTAGPGIGVSNLIYHIEFSYNGVYPINITQNGNSISYPTSSDLRYKENLDYEFNATELLGQLKPVQFNYKNQPSTQYGFIAQDVLPILPQYVITGPDGFYQMDYSHFTGILCKAIKEQNVEIAELKSTVNNLQYQLASLKATVDDLVASRRY